MSTDSPHTIKLQPPGCPDWITPELIEETVDVWSPYYPNQSTEADAVEILRTVGMLCGVKERKAA